MRVAVVAVHGVTPIAQYAFQDAFALALCNALNRQSSAAQWTASVVFPHAAGVEQPTIARVHHLSDSADAPTRDYFDVTEAYWSPLSKGKTSALSVLSWLLHTIFLPINDRARYQERPLKVGWDVGFVTLSIALGLISLAVTAVATAWALGLTPELLSGPGARPTFNIESDIYLAFKTMLNPFAAIGKLTPRAAVALSAGTVGAYFLAQTVRGIWSLVKNFGAVQATDARQTISRSIAISIMMVIGAAGVTYCALASQGAGTRLGWPAVALIVALFGFQSGRHLLSWFVANFFGDVQVYTTRDQNSAFYECRQAILQTVVQAIRNVIVRSTAQEYDRVLIFGHSLGSTIAMDALMHLRNMQREGLIAPENFGRIRGFVTFGTALEKTKYFFNAWNATLSQQYQEWQSALYGSLFTPDNSVLAQPRSPKIYWQNSWYFSDFVADEILSYTYDGDVVADNRGRFGPFNPLALHFVTHADYLNDPWFWKSALEVIAPQ